jgi:hypothetical protein
MEYGFQTEYRTPRVQAVQALPRKQRLALELT